MKRQSVRRSVRSDTSTAQRLVSQANGRRVEEELDAVHQLIQPGNGDGLFPASTVTVSPGRPAAPDPPPARQSTLR